MKTVTHFVLKQLNIHENTSAYYRSTPKFVPYMYYEIRDKWVGVKIIKLPLPLVLQVTGFVATTKKHYAIYFWNDFHNVIFKFSIKFRIRNTLLQKYRSIIVSTVKFEKCFVEFTIPIALLKEIGG